MTDTASIHVGINAFRLVGPQTSIGTYTHELIDALLSQGFTITLYAPREEPGADLDRYLTPESKCKVVFSPRPLQPECFPKDLFTWNQRVLPRMLTNHPCQVFIAPYHQTPCFPPDGVRTLAVIHDLCGLRRDCGYRYFGRAWFTHFWNLLTAALRADRIIPISESTRADMARKFPFARKHMSAPIYNCVSGKTLEVGEARHHVEPLGIPSTPFILAFGLTGPRKGFKTAMQAYTQYRNGGGTLPLVLIGVKNETHARSFIPAEQLRDVIFLPRVSACERDAIYRLATCLLFCSLCEGFGYPIVEAMRQGCPVIAARNTPAAEIVGDTLNLMHPPSAGSCAKLIRDYASLNATRREELGQRLIQQSMRFADANFATRFAAEIRATLAS